MTRKLTSDNSNSTKTIKFLYSYGGRIVLRPTDGQLRYAGGMTRVLSVDRSISYMELAVKFVEACGSSMKLRCKLPTEDLDVLVSVTCDEDLANVIELYERTNQDFKVRAILTPIKAVKKISPPPSPISFSATKPPKYPAPKATQQQQRSFINFSASKATQNPVTGFYSVVPQSYRCTPKAVRYNAGGQRIRPSQYLGLINYGL